MTAHVQTSAEAYGLEVSSFAPSLTGVTAGNHVSVAISYVPSGTANTACPTPTTSWSVAEAPTSTFGTAYAPRAAIFYKQNVSSGTHTATFSLPAGSYIGGQLIEFSGASLTASLDVHANAIGTHASTGTVTTGASTVADSFVIATGCANAISISTPPTTGYTAIGYDDGSNIPYSPGYKVVAATGTQSATWTWTASGETDENYALVIAVFKADAGGGTSNTTATAAAGAATVSGAGASTAAAAGTSAAGVATVSAAGRSTAATGASAAAGVASVSAVGAAVQTTTATPATGAATVSATADSVAAASASAAAGAAAVSGAGASSAVTSGAAAAGTASTGAAGASTAASSATPAAGIATVSGVGSSQAAGQTTAIPASGASTVSAQGASVAACDAVPAAGLASVSATTPSSAPTGSMGFEMGGNPAPRRVRYASIKPMLAAAAERRFPDADEGKPAYSQMRVDEASGALIRAWAAAQGFVSVVDDLHVTLAYSREPVDLSDVPELEGFKLSRGGRGLDQFGDSVVLTLTSARLTEQWQAMRDAGASWDFPQYQPHITVTYEKGGVELAEVRPYTGPIVLLDEERSALDSDFGAEETPVDAAVAAGLVDIQNEKLTPAKVELLAQQWRPAITLAPNTTRQDAQLLYLRAVLAQKQAQEAQEAAIRRAKARADDEQAIAMALRLLF